MTKITKSFRLDPSVVKKLQNLTNFYNEHMQEFAIKKATQTDVIAWIIELEYERAKKEGYNL